jgi:hypothetical protein
VHSVTTYRFRPQDFKMRLGDRPLIADTLVPADSCTRRPRPPGPGSIIGRPKWITAAALPTKRRKSIGFLGRRDFCPKNIP